MLTTEYTVPFLLIEALALEGMPFLVLQSLAVNEKKRWHEDFFINFIYSFTNSHSVGPAMVIC